MESVLAESIKVLSFIVNVATGLAHPLDESRAKELFVALHHHGIPFDHGVVYAMASQNGWKDRHAEQLARLAGRISGGKG